MSRSRVVIGVIGDDIHIVGNRIMQLALEECGFSVYNLRTRNRPERFVQAALEVNAHAVFVSSLNFDRLFLRSLIPCFCLNMMTDGMAGTRGGET